MRKAVVFAVLLVCSFSAAAGDKDLNAQLWEAAVTEAEAVWLLSMGALKDLPEGSSLTNEIRSGTTVPMMLLSQKNPDQPPTTAEVHEAFEQVWGTLKEVYPALVEASVVDRQKANSALKRLNSLKGRMWQKEYPDTVVELNGPVHTGPIAASSTKTRERSQEYEESRSITRSFGPSSLAEMDTWRQETQPKVDDVRENGVRMGELK